MNKIVSLRGTNGAGKSTIVRRIMDDFRSREEINVPNRRKPLGYILDKRVFVPGHYEIANGGVDTLNDIDSAYDLIRTYFQAGLSVLYEGKNMSDGVSRLRFFPPDQVVIIVVDTPVMSCIRSVRERGHNIRVETIEKLAKKVDADALKFTDAGYSVHKLDRARALAKVRETLGIEEAN
jgi:thymidylate kinase